MRQILPPSSLDPSGRYWRVAVALFKLKATGFAHSALQIGSPRREAKLPFTHTRFWDCAANDRMTGMRALCGRAALGLIADWQLSVTKRNKGTLVHPRGRAFRLFDHVARSPLEQSRNDSNKVFLSPLPDQTRQRSSRPSRSLLGSILGY